MEGLCTFILDPKLGGTLGDCKIFFVVPVLVPIHKYV